MRKISLIIVHCSANRAGSAIRMADIDRYHRSIFSKYAEGIYVVAMVRRPSTTMATR